KGVTWIEGDLNNKTALGHLVKDIDTVIHMAGVVKALNWGGFKEVNIIGTRNLIEAFKKNQPNKSKKSHFIYISSITARVPWLSYYGASKRLSENELEKISGHTILRPPAIYGPGDTEILTMFKAFKSGFAPSVGLGRNRFSMIYVDDLVEAICSLIEKPPAKAQIFELDDGANNGYTIREIANITQGIFSRKIYTIPVPPLLLTSIGFLNEIFAKIINKPVMLTHLKAKEILHKDWVVRSNRLEDYTDWVAKT
ncbi:MAG: NAD-dependent epimerase/dehydratase family protein, partial [Sphingomonadales bacterium]